jgi:hypothetical protein
LKVSGFAILRNGVALGYPFEPSLRSLLPLVDELVVGVGVGDGDDETWERVVGIGDPRLRPFRSTWDLTPRDGAVLSQQTNLALARCSGEWAVYLQADEVLHEDDLDILREAMRHHRRRRAEGLLLPFLHFVGSPWRIGDDAFAFYPRAVRVVKTGLGIESAGDACGFVRRRGPVVRGLIKAAVDARVFHYGWCNPADVQLARMRNLRRLYSDREVTTSVQDVFRGGAVLPFRGTHPKAMAGRVQDWPVPVEDRPGTVWRAPAWLRFVREPGALRGYGRPLLPVTLTNAYWTAFDLWQRTRA